MTGLSEEGWNPTLLQSLSEMFFSTWTGIFSRKLMPRVPAHLHPAAPRNLCGHSARWELKQDGVSISNEFCISHGLNQSVPVEFLLVQQAQPICCLEL